MRPAPKASIKLGQPQGGSIPNVILERTFFVALCVVGFGEVTYAADGYRAIGFFTSTVFRASGETTHKNVIMFDVTVVEAEWRIRTEAVRPQGGIAYHEASYNSTNGIFMVTAFDSAVENSDSPLRFLRAELERTNMENLFFKNPPLISAGKSNEAYRSDRFHRWAKSGNPFYPAPSCGCR